MDGSQLQKADNDQSGNPVVQKPWVKKHKEVIDELDVSPEEGLSQPEVESRRKEYGKNRLREAKTRSAWEILVEQFKSLLVVLLVGGAVLSFAFGEVVEGIAILAVVIINAAVGFVTELRAVRSMEALHELGSVESKVRRDGSVKTVDAESLVPGDIVVLESGDVVTADLRLIKVSKLQADESALTGESVPVGKTLEPFAEETPLAERSNMVFKGTAITRGNGAGVVVATGMDTELGKISELVEEAEQEVTPLEQRLNKLGQRLAYVTLGVAALVAVSGIVAGRDTVLIFQTAIALAVAAVPEGLPIVATVALARGMRIMAERNALINRLSAVETLGGTNVICTDKTGTLTENRMTVVQIETPTGDFRVTGRGLDMEGEFKRGDQVVDPLEREPLLALLQTGVLCSEASLDAAEKEAVGEPLEVALLVAGNKAGLSKEELESGAPRMREVAFDPEVKMMATYHEVTGESPLVFDNGSYYVAVKGAASVVLEACSRLVCENGPTDLTEELRQEWIARDDELAERGLRMLAIAFKTVDSQEVEPYQDLTFLGLAALLDPPREEVRPSIEASKKAGLKIVMVTGDHPATARNVGLAVGLVENEDAEVVLGREIEAPEDASREKAGKIRNASLLARVNPAQKLDLIALHQAAGNIVAMTGDGVNDAPALKKADIGIAMGQRGTQVAKEAADMILQDDSFSSIVAAIHQGRVIFSNIRKFVVFLLSCNTSEILVVGVAAVINAPLPIRPLQILFLNLVTDVFPALALGVGKGSEGIMERPPRDPDEPVLDRRSWIGIGAYGLMITASVLGVFWLAFNWLQADETMAVTISFLTLAFAQIWHVFNMRSRDANLIKNEVTTNKWVWGAVLLSVSLLLAAVFVQPLADLLRLTMPSMEGWLLILAGSLLPLVAGQIYLEVAGSAD